MKTFTMIILATCSISAIAGYDYTINDGYFGSMTIKRNESLLITGGGGDILTVEDYGIVDILNTAPLQWDSGGLVDTNLTDWSHLSFFAGEIANLHISDNAECILYGGRIDTLDSWQITWKYEGQPAELVWIPHIEMLVKDYTYNTLTKILRGTWGDDSLFNIQLIDHTNYGYDPAIDNIKFTIIPEPLSLLLFAAGGLVVCRRK